MSLLEVITNASSTVSTPSHQESNYPIVLNPDPIFLKLKPETDDLPAQNPVKKVGGWEISQIDSDLIELGQNFFKNISRKLKNTNTFTKDKFLGIVASHLEKIGEKVSAGVDKSEEVCVPKLLEKLGVFMGRDVKVLVLKGCINLEVWDVVESLISNRIVEHSSTSNLVYNLIEKRKSDLIVLCVKQLMDLQTYDLMCILKYFLVLPVDGYKSLISLRGEWESQALLAIERSEKKSLAKKASVLIMLAYDGFSVSELCMHYLLASRNLDEVIFAASVGKLNGEEIKGLIKYLGKWLKKYERFPQVGPCPTASSKLGLKICDWIPSLENVVKYLGLVVDEHFSSLVLHSECHEELKSLEGVVSLLAAEARLCGTLANLTERLKSELKVKPPRNIAFG